MRPRLTIDMLKQAGPPVHLRDLAALTGLSKDTLGREIAAGTLKASRRQKGRCTLFLIARAEARRYVATMFHDEQLSA